MDSLGKDCIELKKEYEKCFNYWYSERFLKNKEGDLSICEPLFQEYQKCLKVAIKKNNIPLWELDKVQNENIKKSHESGTSA
uniref:TP53-regulated inhibitor of apoptosis 1 n=1 Tax=Parasteatoda tepidariorum TaxID=114398 RepID=A0A2L2YN68_PARTP|nr:TP53-regulated inhibitor of apoptosis 1 [Parasteatoda tepidariorum]